MPDARFVLVCGRRVRQSRTAGFLLGAAGADPGRDGGKRRYYEQGPSTTAISYQAGGIATATVVAHGRDQPDAGRDAENGPGSAGSSCAADSPALT